MIKPQKPARPLAGADKHILVGLVRHLLTLGAGYLVTVGWIDESSAEQLSGAVLTLVVVAWSAVNKRKVEVKINEKTI